MWQLTARHCTTLTNVAAAAVAGHLYLLALLSGGMLAVKVVQLGHLMGPGHESALRREALVLELAAMQDYDHPHLLTMQASPLHLCW